MKTDGELIACKSGRFLQQSPKQDRTLDIFFSGIGSSLISLACSRIRIIYSFTATKFRHAGKKTYFQCEQLISFCD